MSAILTKRVAVAVAALLVAGCASSPPEHFYTLTGPLAGSAAPLPAAAPSAAPIYISVQGVDVPQQVARSQLVVSTGAGRLDILEQERWGAPLSAEIGQALSSGLSARLGAIDVFRTPYPESLPVYRISTNVLRFESAPGEHALVDAVWSVRKLPDGSPLTCRSVAEEKIAPGYDALVAGHRRAVDKVAAAMAAAIRSLAGGGAAVCPPAQP